MRRHLMKRKGLYFLIALALGGVGAVHAQDTAAPADASASSSYDGRWYIAPTLGGYYNDTDRNTNSRQIYYGLGVGRFISSNTSIDLFIDRTKRDRDSRSEEHTSELQSLMRISYDVFCLKNKN